MVMWTVRKKLEGGRKRRRKGEGGGGGGGADSVCGCGRREWRQGKQNNGNRERAWSHKATREPIVLGNGGRHARRESARGEGDKGVGREGRREKGKGKGCRRKEESVIEYLRRVRRGFGKD